MYNGKCSVFSLSKSAISQQRDILIPGMLRKSIILIEMTPTVFFLLEPPGFYFFFTLFYRGSIRTGALLGRGLYYFFHEKKIEFTSFSLLRALFRLVPAYQDRGSIGTGALLGPGFYFFFQKIFSYNPGVLLGRVHYQDVGL